MYKQKYQIVKDDDGEDCAMVPLSAYDLSLIYRSVARNSDTTDLAKSGPLAKLREAMQGLRMVD
jgi:hypothetical protein